MSYSNIDIKIGSQNKSLNSLFSRKSSAPSSNYASRYNTPSSHQKEERGRPEYERERFNRFVRPSVSYASTVKNQIVKESIIKKNNAVKSINPTNHTNPNSLITAIEHIREGIIERASSGISGDFHPESQKSLSTFQSKFIPVRDNWNALMNYLVEKFSEVDKKHMTHNYYGLREKIISQILNISLSYIIVGGETKFGNGVENIYNLTPDKSLNSLTVRQRINLYLRQIIPAIDSISEKYIENVALDKAHMENLQLINSNKSLIQTLKASLKEQEKEISLINRRINARNKAIPDQNISCELETIPEGEEEENVVSDDDLVKMIEENMRKNRIALKKAISEEAKLDSNVKNIIFKKLVNNDAIDKSFNDASRFLHFSYFMHDDYDPAIDNGLVSKLTTNGRTSCQR